jgi:hypothetical protein
MDVERYETQTRENVEKFLKRQKQAITNEIVRLGGAKRCINWQTLKLILKDLKREGLVRESHIGNQVILYEWVGS